MFEIEIKVVKRQATVMSGGTGVVCGNPLKLKFSFDEEWQVGDGTSVINAKLVFWHKTRFENILCELIQDGEYYSCITPALFDIKTLEIGACIDNGEQIHTTTGAKIACIPSIRCNDSISVLGSNAMENLAASIGISGLDAVLESILNLQEEALYHKLVIQADNYYPVGSIYMSVNDTSPSSLFGGEWERLEGRFLLGAGEIKEYNKNGTQTDEDGNNYNVFTYNAGSTGGSAYAVVVAHQHYVDVIGGIGRDEITSGYNAILQTGIAQNNNSILTQTRGEDGTGKNMPPYLAVYMWKRTA